mmetsp:Transcript_128490/g.411842  ORF Transcript_128490/g.411842 Transcript_128490/m.411842 type:complete len:240 (-) Transcript_128490:277-996(-)
MDPPIRPISPSTFDMAWADKGDMENFDEFRFKSSLGAFNSAWIGFQDDGSSITPLSESSSPARSGRHQENAAGPDLLPRELPEAPRRKHIRIINRKLIVDRGAMFTEAQPDSPPASSATASSTPEVETGARLALPEDFEDLNMMLPLDGCGLLASIGSSKHGEGVCKQCLFHLRPGGCLRGELCEFCHIQHSGGARRRPCKAKRQRYKKIIEQQLMSLARGGEETYSALPSRDCGGSGV